MTEKQETTAVQRRHDAILARQQQEWPARVLGAKAGNPYATLCQHCFGRHVPPRDEICPNAAARRAAS